MAYFESTSGAQFSLAQVVTSTTASTNVFDVTGAGVGNVPAMTGIDGTNNAMGIDFGAGDGMAKAQIWAFFASNPTGTGTFQIQLQAAPDNGSYSPGSYVTLFSTEAVVANTLSTSTPFKFDIPPIPYNLALPRFYRLNYVTTGTVSVPVTAQMLLNAPDIRIPTLYGSNIQSV